MSPYGISEAIYVAGNGIICILSPMEGRSPNRSDFSVLNNVSSMALSLGSGLARPRTGSAVSLSRRCGCRSCAASSGSRPCCPGVQAATIRVVDQPHFRAAHRNGLSQSIKSRFPMCRSLTDQPATRRKDDMRDFHFRLIDEAEPHRPSSLAK